MSRHADPNVTDLEPCLDIVLLETKQWREHSPARCPALVSTTFQRVEYKPVDCEQIAG